jgi:hypothetical protein
MRNPWEKNYFSAAFKTLHFLGFIKISHIQSRICVPLNYIPFSTNKQKKLHGTETSCETNISSDSQYIFPQLIQANSLSSSLKQPTTNTILSQTNVTHALPSNFFTCHFDVIILIIPRHSKDHFFFTFPPKTCSHIFITLIRARSLGHVIYTQVKRQ